MEKVFNFTIVCSEYDSTYLTRMSVKADNINKARFEIMVAVVNHNSRYSKLYTMHSPRCVSIKELN